MFGKQIIIKLLTLEYFNINLYDLFFVKHLSYYNYDFIIVIIIKQCVV